MTKPQVASAFRARRRRAALSLLDQEREAAEATHACRCCGLQLLRSTGERQEAGPSVTTDLVVECPDCGTRNVLRLPASAYGEAPEYARADNR